MPPIFHLVTKFLDRRMDEGAFTCFRFMSYFYCSFLMFCSILSPAYRKLLNPKCLYEQTELANSKMKIHVAKSVLVMKMATI